MGVYEDLVAWSLARPAWQRDALRRLAQQTDLRAGDVSELADLATAEAQSASSAAVPQPLTLAHLPSSSRGECVRLKSISAVENVNALARGVRLEFAENGLTVIYGDNGSGKSGYVRILKQVCRARAAGARIQPNVFASAHGPSAATVEFRSGEPVRAARWSPTLHPPEALGAISIYDRECASVYVTGENEVAYRPFGLDVLDGLARVMDEVRAELHRRKPPAPHSLLSPPPDLLGAAPLAGIWPLTTSVSSTALATHSRWTDADSEELASLERALAEENPLSRAAALRSVWNTYLKAGRRARDVAGAVAAEAIEKLADARRLDVAATEALRTVAHDTFDKSPVPGVGSEAWQQLWAAAERFAEDAAYPGHTFPDLTPGSRCVLCGQELNDEARLRFGAFRTFMEGAVNELATDARRAFDDASTSVRIAVTSEEQDRTLIDELQVVDSSQAARVKAFLDAARARASAAFEACESGRWDSIPPAVDSPEASLAEAAGNQRTEAELLERVGQPDQVLALRKRVIDLRARKWLDTYRDAIAAECDRLKLLASLDRAIESCDTHAITNESNILTERYVTRKLAAALERELEDLNATRLPIRVAKRGERGATFHRLELHGSRIPGVKVEEVASEGEFGALAMAAFLAEIGESGSDSGVVLDDPVSSLDHRHRRRVAERLVREAATRQVVVFTHDLVFLHDLQMAAMDRNVPVALQRLRVRDSSAGVPDDGAPWQAQKTSTRIGYLQDALAKARSAYVAKHIEDYELLARDWYGLLRETWEHAVEETLFGAVVLRHRHNVETKRVSSAKVWMMTEEDAADLDRGMARCSAQLRGHDQPAAANDPVPPPQELATDLEDLKNWVNRIERRRKA